MSRRAPPSPAVDLQALPADTNPDATLFIRISGPPRRPPPAPVAPAAKPVQPPPPPVRQLRPPLPPPIHSGPPVVAAPSGPGFQAHPARLTPPVASVPPDSPFQVKVLPPERAAGVDARLYGTVVVCCAAVCAGLVAVVFAAVGPGPSMADDASGFGGRPDGVVVSVDAEDTGGWYAEDGEDGDEAETGPGSSASAGPSKPVVSPAPAVPAGGGLTIDLPDPRGITSIAVSCPSGFTGRSTYGQAPYVIDGVPGEQCTLWFRGASPYKFVGVSGGQRLTCAFPSGVAWCE